MNPTESPLPNTVPDAQGQGSSAYPAFPTMPADALGISPGPAAIPAPPTLVPPPPVSGSAAWLPPTVPVQPSGTDGSSDGSATGSAVDAPAVADDGDLIEKEWVTRAKQIVDKTRQDPYMQTKELHKFKAEYMKKRYNKIIEPVEE